MADQQGDTAPVDFDDPGLTWGDEDPPAAAPPPATDDTEDTPSADADAAPSSEAAITPSAPEASEEGGDRQPQGPIPFDRHEAILAKAREETAAERAKVESVAWATELQAAGRTPEQIQQALNIVQGLDADPVGFLERYHARLQEHPELAGPLKSWAGKVLASRQAASGAATPQMTQDGDTEPQPDFQNEQGIGFYSGPQLQKWQSWQARQQKAEIQALLQPLQQAETQRQQQAAALTLYQQQDAKTKAELTEYRKIPAFAENEGKIKAYLESVDYKVPLAAAFNHVLVTDILPNAGQTAKAAQLAELQTKAGAGTVTPSSSAAATPTAPTDFDDPSLKWE